MYNYAHIHNVYFRRLVGCWSLCMHYSIKTYNVLKEILIFLYI